MGRRPASVAPALFVLAFVLILGAAAALPQAAAAASIGSYRGLGTWVDLYDAKAWDDPAAAVKDMDSHGVRTLYLETANYHWPSTLNRPAALGALIEQAHARGIKVVAWYLPGFKDPSKDYKRSMAAIKFRSASGQKFDSFTLDIEASIVKDVGVRNSRLRSLSRRIRAAVGSRYPLGACIPSPAGMAMHTSYWPNFPYKTLAGIYDVFVPMGYYTYHGDGYANAYRDTRDNIRIIREKTGKPNIPIHVIAGDAAKSSGSETTAYVRALRENGALGGSMYDWATTSNANWRVLRNVRTNPRQTPALPLALPFAARLGYCGADRTHPKEVFYTIAGQKGDKVLHFRLYDVQAGEVRLLVNWKDAGPLAAGPLKRWSRTRSVDDPGVDAQADGPQRHRLRRPRRLPGVAALGRPRREAYGSLTARAALCGVLPQSSPGLLGCAHGSGPGGRRNRHRREQAVCGRRGTLRAYARGHRVGRV